MSDDSILERVRKLLAKAEDPACPPAEAEAFNDKAAELIAKYGVDQALLAADRPDADPVGDRVIQLDAPYALDKGDLLSAIALALRCQVVRRKRWVDGGYRHSVHLFGCQSDLERTELLYTSLLVQAAYGMGAALVPPWESTVAYRRSWLAGFTAAVSRRLRAAEQRAAATADSSGSDGPSMALVLADRSALVSQRLQQMYPKLGKAKPRRLQGSGVQDGYAAGQRADLGGTRIGQGRVRQLGRA